MYKGRLEWADHSESESLRMAGEVFSPGFCWSMPMKGIHCTNQELYDKIARPEQRFRFDDDISGLGSKSLYHLFFQLSGRYDSILTLLRHSLILNSHYFVS